MAGKMASTAVPVDAMLRNSVKALADQTNA